MLPGMGGLRSPADGNIVCPVLPSSLHSLIVLSVGVKRKWKGGWEKCKFIYVNILLLYLLLLLSVLCTVVSCCLFVVDPSTYRWRCMNNRKSVNLLAPEFYI